MSKNLDLQKIVHKIVIKNCEKADDDIPSAYYQTVNRILTLKGRKNLFMNTEKSKTEPTNPKDFFPGATTSGESSELFSRVGYIGCCETENYCAIMTIHRNMKNYDKFQYKDIEIIDYGLCIAKPKIDLISLIYEYDVNKSVDEWEAVHQKSNHEFVYFLLENNQTIYLDLTIAQFGIYDSFIEEPGIGQIPIVFDYSSNIMKRYPDIYSNVSLKSNKDTLSRESDKLEAKIEKFMSEGSVDQKRVASITKKNLLKLSDIVL